MLGCYSKELYYHEELAACEAGDNLRMTGGRKREMKKKGKKEVKNKTEKKEEGRIEMRGGYNRKVD